MYCFCCLKPLTYNFRYNAMGCAICNIWQPDLTGELIYRNGLTLPL